jgi:hypothetical protein
MGGSGATDETVCKGCNGLINRRVETPALPSFLPFQSLFGIRGRRNDIRRVPGTITVDGETGHVSLNDRGEITAAVVIPIKSADGKPNYLLFGPKDLVEAKMRTLTARNPALKWEESGPEADRAQVFVEVDPHLSRLHLRRLAAKVAFERWAQRLTSLNTFIGSAGRVSEQTACLRPPYRRSPMARWLRRRQQ